MIISNRIQLTILLNYYIFKDFYKVENNNYNFN